MRHDRGLAASPLVRYTLLMGGRELSPFPFSFRYPPPMSPPLRGGRALLDGALDHLPGIAQRTRRPPVRRRRQRLDLRPLLIGQSPFTRHGLATPCRTADLRRRALILCTRPRDAGV